MLGVDRDSELVAHLFDERNDAVKQTIAQVIRAAHAAGRKIGICGQAPSDYPEFAQFLVAQGIDSISLNPDSVAQDDARDRRGGKDDHQERRMPELDAGRRRAGFSQLACHGGDKPMTPQTQRGGWH